MQSGHTEGFGEDACPAAPKRPPKLDLQGAPRFAVHPIDPVIALNFDRALTFISRVDGHVLSSFSHAGFTVKGVAASDGEWLLWVQRADGADHLYLADGAELTTPAAERPFVRSVSIVRLPQTFGWKKDTRGTPDSPCDFFEKGVMTQPDVLFLDWRADSKPIDVRVKGQGGQLQKWKVDVGSATPLPGLQVERMQLAKQGRWRLRIQFPFALEALAIVEGGAKVPKLRPIVAPVSTASTEPACVFVDQELKPERFMLNPIAR